MDRFWNKVSTTDGCWEWQAGLNPEGYGWFWFDGGPRYAHVVAYQLTHGAIPDGLVIDHTCENRACVNPDHLEPVTSGVNLIRSATTLAGINARKTHCKRGHEFTPENTYQRPGTDTRECLTCKQEYNRNYHKKVIHDGRS